MSRLALTFACCRYDRMEAIREGDVVPAGLTLNCITLRSGREISTAGWAGRNSTWRSFQRPNSSA
jgi:hypothetical protein